MPKLVCLDCRTEYQIESNEVYCVDMALDPPQPYRITACDMWVCPGCGKKILAGFAKQGYEHYEEEFPKLLEKITGEDVTLRVVHNWRGRENLINRLLGEGHVNVIYNYEKAQNQERSTAVDELRVLRSIAEGDDFAELFPNVSEDAKRIEKAIKKLQKMNRLNEADNIR